MNWMLIWTWNGYCWIHWICFLSFYFLMKSFCWTICSLSSLSASLFLCCFVHCPFCCFWEIWWNWCSLFGTWDFSPKPGISWVLQVGVVLVSLGFCESAHCAAFSPEVCSCRWVHWTASRARFSASSTASLSRRCRCRRCCTRSRPPHLSED